MTTFAYMAVSLDGYIADRDGGVDWLNSIPNPNESDFGYGDFIKNIDALLMGATTFRFLLSLGVDVWPYDRPVFVASRSFEQVPEGYGDRISLVRGDMRDMLSEIRAAGYERLYVDGGTLIQSCLRQGLLDEMILTRIPILLGGGVPLFADLDEAIHLEHQSTKVMDSGLIQSHYLVDDHRRAPHEPGHSSPKADPPPE